MFERADHSFGVISWKMKEEVPIKLKKRKRKFQVQKGEKKILLLVVRNVLKAENQGQEWR